MCAGYAYPITQSHYEYDQIDSSVERGPMMFQIGVGSVLRCWDEGESGERSRERVINSSAGGS